MLCPNCGKEVPGESKTCPYCGTELKSAKKRKHSNIKIILPIVIVMILLLSSFAMYQVIKTHTGTNQKQEVPASNSTNNEQKNPNAHPLQERQQVGILRQR